MDHNTSAFLDHMNSIAASLGHPPLDLSSHAPSTSSTITSSSGDMFTPQTFQAMVNYFNGVMAQNGLQQFDMPFPPPRTGPSSSDNADMPFPPPRTGPSSSDNADNGDDDDEHPSS